MADDREARGKAILQFLTAASRYALIVFGVLVLLWVPASWVSLQPLVVNEVNPNASNRSKSIVSFIDKLFFGFFLCAIVLLGEKIAIQFIAKHFHEESYANRIEQQKESVEILIALYSHTTHIPVPPLTTISGARDRNTFNSASPSVKPTTSILRQVAKNLLGFSFLLPDSTESDVLTALCSANETRILARRIFYSFVRQGETALVLTDIAQYFNSEDEATKAFNFFDKDGNGDVTQEEVEMACMECHNEQLSLANSLKDLDSAVGRLDNIFMTLYTFIAILILAVVLDSQLSTLLIGTGTFILGLSWLIGGSLTEVLTGIIFLFVKHPYDVGDRVVIDSIPYTVREIQLVFHTILLDNNNTAIQAPHSCLAVKNIANIRRSPTMSETFMFDVAFDTKLESLETLRDQMLAFVKENCRDFMPVFDIVVLDIPGQSKMTLSADIKYKSNWQHGTLKNGPADAGAPSKPKVPKMYTEVPWSEAQKLEPGIIFSDPKSTLVSKLAVSTHDSLGHNNLLHKNAGICEYDQLRKFRLIDGVMVLVDSSQNAFGENEELAMSNPVLRSPKTPITPKRDEDPRSH
ncbi:hypothetical protein Clacol_000282 [Clathrus columnatus]|uniref:EF-hand domain-containing protein n=1 Tax=Clathrus columnatus TaxID=1419009 RepID=A0AAV4ZY74_9AGAM|nr:hypothetical protein Clacol_000282 [Clathrus columnatus]